MAEGMEQVAVDEDLAADLTAHQTLQSASNRSSFFVTGLEDESRYYLFE
jgi:hypothetical protein